MTPPTPASTDKPDSSPEPSGNASPMADPGPSPHGTAATPRTAPPSPESRPCPASSGSTNCTAKPSAQLLERAAALRFRINPDKTRHHIVFDLLKAYAQRGTELFADGILEFSPQGSGFLRWPRYNFRSLPQDVYVPAQIERQFFLRNGNRLSARIRPPRDREKFMTIDRVLTIEDIPVANPGRKPTSSTASPRCTPPSASSWRTPRSSPSPRAPSISSRRWAAASAA